MITDGQFYSYKKSEGNGYNEELRNCIENACQCCLDSVGVSGVEKINKPIMLLGKIQSGKTRAYTGLIALAFDNGFDMVFILTKNSKALVEQTELRMRKEFKTFIDNHRLVVSDIKKSGIQKSGYELEQKNIVIAKKQTKNMEAMIEFVRRYSIGDKYKCLIIDDEADTTGIGYEKEKGEDAYSLRKIASQVNELRGALVNCVFVQVTATPYALYLQPDFDADSEIRPVKPDKTVLVPYGKDYIGGDYYFIQSREDTHPASLLFEPIGADEHNIVSDSKTKGKLKVQDRRVLKIEELLKNEKKLPVFKKGIFNFFVGVLALSYDKDKLDFDYTRHFAYVIHTSTKKGSHVELQAITEAFLEQIHNRTGETEKNVKGLLELSYQDIEHSMCAYGWEMPPYEKIKKELLNVIDKEHYSVTIVNSDDDVINLLNPETGELKLSTPFSIFIGGEILDRGITVPNMIGFYYGRNPKNMQQDTVLQHSRMFGYRKPLLSVTRFYTTERIHSNMERITEIDEALRKDIEQGKQGEGVYFMMQKKQNPTFGKGSIIPCSPAKISATDVRMLNAYKRILPVGFTPVCKTYFDRVDKRIENTLTNARSVDASREVYSFTIGQIEELLSDVYETFRNDEEKKDEDEKIGKFIVAEQMITYLRYFAKEDKAYCIVFRNRNNAKYRRDGRLLDSPYTSQGSENENVRKYAEEAPCLTLYKENGTAEGWDGREFWWPVLVAPRDVPKSIYAYDAKPTKKRGNSAKATKKKGKSTKKAKSK